MLITVVRLSSYDVSLKIKVLTMKFSQNTLNVSETYPRQSAPNRWKLTEERIFQRQSRWKKCWTNHLALQLKYRSSDHLLKYRAQGNIAPSKRCRFERQLVQYAKIYTHAERKTKQQINLSQLQFLNLEEILLKLLETFRKPFKNVNHDWFLAILRAKKKLQKAILLQLVQLIVIFVTEE